MGDDDAEARKAEVRARMAEQTALNSKKKKGFMTPARKSKLRMLLRKKAAEELKKEEERKKEERKRAINQRCGEEKKLDGANADGLRAIVEEYYKHIMEVEDSKYDMERRVIFNDYEISELTRKVTNLKGKFVKPVLKKISKFEDKFAQLNKKAAEFKFKVELSQADLGGD